MTNQIKPSFGRGELEFFGKITASVTHEINNILSIINEYSGLLEDLVLIAEKGTPIDGKRIEQIAQNISEQMNREKNIIKLLNRFAHRVDSHISRFDLFELLKDITRLSRRFASLKKVELKTIPPVELIDITNSPFVMQHAIFKCILIGLDYSTSGDCITLSLTKTDTEANISILTPFDNNSMAADEVLKPVHELMNSIGGKLKYESSNGNNYNITLTLPLSLSDEVIDSVRES